MKSLSERIRDREREINRELQMSNIEKMKKKGFTRVKKMTLKDLSRTLGNALEMDKNIRRCVISITDVKKVIGKECYRVEQIFTDINNVPVYANEEATEIYANVVLADSLDEDLKNMLGDQETVTFEL